MRLKDSLELKLEVSLESIRHGSPSGMSGGYLKSIYLNRGYTGSSDWLMTTFWIYFCVKIT